MECGSTGGFPPGGPEEVGADEREADDDVVPLVFRASGGCTFGLVVDSEEVCKGLREVLEECTLGVGSMGAGCFPLETGGVGI